MHSHSPNPAATRTKGSLTRHSAASVTLADTYRPRIQNNSVKTRRAAPIVSLVNAVNEYSRPGWSATARPAHGVHPSSDDSMLNPAAANPSPAKPRSINTGGTVLALPKLSSQPSHP